LKGRDGKVYIASDPSTGKKMKFPTGNVGKKECLGRGERTRPFRELLKWMAS